MELLIWKVESIIQADALYHLGDFEHALVYYHRGLRCVEWIFSTLNVIQSVVMVRNVYHQSASYTQGFRLHI